MDGCIVVKKSQKYWYEDGNVVLEARDDDHIVQFRLHRSVLSQHSPVFRSLLSLPQSGNSPTVDGCPIFPLSDPPEDLENLVTLLYDTLSVCNFKDNVTFNVLSAMLHFGKKYQIQKLRDDAVYRLQNEFPSTLAAWDSLWPARQNDYILYELVFLAHEHSIVSILPALYLHICLSDDIHQIIDGFHASGEYHGEPGNCIIGRERLLDSVSSKTLYWLHDGGKIPCPTCPCPEYCTNAKKDYLAEIWPHEARDLLHFAINAWEENDIEIDLCEDCSDAAKAEYSQARKIIWDDLKSYFNIDIGGVASGIEVQRTKK